MKIAFRLIMVSFALAAMGCRDKATEKRIEDMETRLKQLESNKPVGAPIPGLNPGPNASTSTPVPAAEEKPTGPLPKADFETVEHDFGTVSEGGKVSYVYKVKNNGQAPLIIQNAQPSCGCTVPDWTREPIPVGGTGFVKAEFDTNGKQGVQTKTITVTSNTWPKATTLRFKAMITPKQ